VEFDDELEDGEAPAALLPADDRLWRHPSEMGALVAEPAPEPWTATPWHQAFEPRFWTIVLVAGTIGALLGTGATLISRDQRPGVAGIAGLGHRGGPAPVARVVSTAPSPVVRGGTGGLMDVVTMTQRIRPSIVGIETEGPAGVRAGSGVLFRRDGYALTSSAVVAGSTSITAVLADGRRLTARLIGSDPDTGIAVAKIEPATAGGGLAGRVAVAGPGFVPATLGSSASLTLSQPLLAVGSSVTGTEGPDLTVGLIRDLQATVEAVDHSLLGGMITTDSPVDPDAAGGAQLDSQGDVVGITGIGAASPDGDRAGFATPIEVATAVASDLLTTGRVRHAWLGVNGKDLDLSNVTPSGAIGGAVVQTILPSSPAALTELAPGDVITAIDNRVVHSMAGVITALRTHHPGDRVAIHTERHGHEIIVSAVLAERP
jgi:putative serine protease PepD